jgi:MFS family permease
MRTSETEPEPPHIIPADRRLRAIVVAALVLSTAIGLVLIRWVLPWGFCHLARQEPRVVLRVVQAIIAVVLLSVVPLALYLYRLGWRAVRHRQIPPPGLRVIVNARVITGDRAVRRGRLAMILAIVLAVLALFGGLYFPYRLEKAFGSRPARPPTESVPPSPEVEDPAPGATP